MPQRVQQGRATRGRRLKPCDQLILLGDIGNRGQPLPQADLGAIAHLRHQPGQRGDPRQKDFLVEQIGGGLVKEQTRTFRCCPRPNIEPACQAPMLGLGLKREIVALGNNASLVVPMDPALKVHGEVGRGVEAELFGEIFANVRQDVPGIINKGSEKPHSAELHGAAPLRLFLPERA